MIGIVAMNATIQYVFLQMIYIESLTISM